MPFDAPSATQFAARSCPEKRRVITVVMIYVIVATAWILASDRLLGVHFADPALMVSASIAKGLLFIVITAALLTLLLNRLVARLTERETALRLITEQAGDAVVVLDSALLVIYANPSACLMTGYRLEELRGRPVAELLPVDTHSILTAHVERLGHVAFSRDEWRLLGQDGSEKIVDITTQRLPDGRYLAIGRDLSESREVQRQLASERRRLKTLVDAIPDAVWLKDTAGMYLACNPVAESYFDRRESEIVQHGDLDLYPPEIAHHFVDSDQQVMRSRQTHRFEQSLVHPDGSLRQLETTKTPIFDAAGHVIGVLGIARDVTLAHAARDALQASEKRFRTLFESARDAVFVIAPDGRLCNVNQQACVSLGYSRLELLGRRVTDVDVDYAIEKVNEIWLTLPQDDGITIYGHHRRADGSLFPVEVRLSRYELDEQHCYLALARDITEREQTLGALRRSEEFSRAVLDSTSSQVAVLDRDGCIVAVNEAWRRFAGERKSLPVQAAGCGVGVNFLEVCRTSRGAYSDSAIAAYLGVLGVLQGEARRFCLDCPCESADETLWFFMNVTPLRSPAGGAVVTYLDITEIKCAQAMQERAANQLKALASKHLSIQEEERRLLSLELHDQIGQLLTSLKLNLASLQHTVPTEARLATADDIVDQLLDTTRDISRRLRPPMLDDLGLTPAVRWHVNNLSLPPDVSIDLHDNLGQERMPPAVELACFRLVQEAVSNALRHARARSISVTLRRQPDGVQLAILDDGIGFDIEETFRQSQNLTSLGLLGMRERVASLDGNFQLFSTPEAGTNLTASFPLDAQT